MSRLMRTELRVVVLSEGPLPDDLSLAQIDHETTDGAWVLGNYSQWPDIVSSEELTPEAMAEALEVADSTPDFFEATRELT